MFKYIFSIIIVAALSFWAGRRSSEVPVATEPADEAGLSADFTAISQKDMREYLELKSQREKFDKANEILAKVMQLFIADLGLRSAAAPQCKLPDRRAEKAAGKAAPTELPPTMVAPPTESTAAKPTTSEYIAQPATTAAAAAAPEKSTAANDKSPTSGRRGPIAPEKAKNAVHALYQAILWRAPDERGGDEATRRMTESGWSAYMSNARRMVRSREFLQDVVPNHTPEQIIHRMYAVYFGRCAFAQELAQQLDSLKIRGASEVVNSIIGTARRRNADQILSGGFSPTSCKE